MNDVIKCSWPFYHVRRFAFVLVLYLDVGSMNGYNAKLSYNGLELLSKNFCLPKGIFLNKLLRYCNNFLSCTPPNKKVARIKIVKLKSKYQAIDRNRPISSARRSVAFAFKNNSIKMRTNSFSLGNCDCCISILFNFFYGFNPVFYK